MAHELRKAHQDNAPAVVQTYDFSVKDMIESACFSALVKMYQKLVTSK